MKRSEVKQKYESLRKDWRQKYGVFSIEKIKGVEDAECIQHAADLLVALGEHRATHRASVRNRAYQRKWRWKNIDKTRAYHRAYKRKRRMH